MNFSKNINSSVISTIAYRGKSLYVKLNSGKAYEYKHVPRKVAVAFVNAKSAGKFYNQEIIGQFDSEVVTF